MGDTKEKHHVRQKKTLVVGAENPESLAFRVAEPGSNPSSALSAALCESRARSELALSNTMCGSKAGRKAGNSRSEGLVAPLFTGRQVHAYSWQS